MLRIEWNMYTVYQLEPFEVIYVKLDCSSWETIRQSQLIPGTDDCAYL